MTIAALSISTGAATCSVAGGTAKTFTPTGKKLNGNGIMVADATVVDPRTRPAITAYATTPAYNAKTMIWSDESREITFSIPVTQADGSTKYRTGRVKMNFEAGISAASLAELRAVLGQLCFDADLDSFYTSGNLA